MTTGFDENLNKMKQLLIFHQKFQTTSNTIVRYLAIFIAHMSRISFKFFELFMILNVKGFLTWVVHWLVHVRVCVCVCVCVINIFNIPFDINF